MLSLCRFGSRPWRPKAWRSPARLPAVPASSRWRWPSPTKPWVSWLTLPSSSTETGRSLSQDPLGSARAASALQTHAVSHRQSLIVCKKRKKRRKNDNKANCWFCFWLLHFVHCSFRFKVKTALSFHYRTERCWSCHIIVSRWSTAHRKTKRSTLCVIVNTHRIHQVWKIH